MQSYSEWASTFLDLLYDERQPDILQRKKCIGTFELISTYSMRSRARCLLSAYMIAQGRLLVDAYEESRLVYTQALATLGKELQKAKSSVPEMQSAVGSCEMLLGGRGRGRKIGCIVLTKRLRRWTALRRRIVKSRKAGKSGDRSSDCSSQWPWGKEKLNRRLGWLSSGG